MNITDMDKKKKWLSPKKLQVYSYQLLVAVVFILIGVACSSDDGDDRGAFTSSSIRITAIDNYKKSYVITYNGKNQLESVYYPKRAGTTYSFNYQAKKLIYSNYYGVKQSYDVDFSDNGYISHIEWNDTTYVDGDIEGIAYYRIGLEYENGYLKNWEKTSGSDETFRSYTAEVVTCKYSDGNLVTMAWEERNHYYDDEGKLIEYSRYPVTMTMVYSGEKNASGISPFFGCDISDVMIFPFSQWFDDEPLFFAILHSSGLLGKMPVNLCTDINASYTGYQKPRNDNIKLSYGFDSNGHVNSVRLLSDLYDELYNISYE